MFEYSSPKSFFIPAPSSADCGHVVVTDNSLKSLCYGKVWGFIHRHFILAICLPLFIAALLFAQPARAVELGMAVDNSLFDLAAFPGETINNKLKIINKNPNAPLPVSITLTLWDVKNDTGDIEFVENSPAINPVKWFTFSGGTELLLEAGEEKTINFTITPPKDAAPGSYFVMSRFNPALPEIYFDQGNARQIPQIGALFFIKVSPLMLDGKEVAYAASIKTIQIISHANQVKTLEDLVMPKAQAGVLDEAVQKMVISIVNSGIYHFKSAGYVEIKNWYGRTVDKISLPERYLLPGKTRTIKMNTLVLNENIKSFWARLWNLIYATFKTKTYIGPYTALIHLNIPETKAVEAHVTFWILPWKFWSPLLLVLGIVAIFLWHFRNRVRQALRVLSRGSQK